MHDTITRRKHRAAVHRGSDRSITDEMTPRSADPGPTAASSAAGCDGNDPRLDGRATDECRSIDDGSGTAVWTGRDGGP